MLKNPKNFRKAIVIAFLIVPLLASIISTVHVIDLFNLGNWTWMSIVLAVLFEAGQLASLLAITVLDKLNKFFVWSIFTLLAIMQIIGNVYFSYDYMTHKLITNPDWLDTAKELFDNFSYKPFEIVTVKAYLAIVLGGIIPIISIAFLKSLTDYLKPQDTNVIENIPIDDPVVVQDTPPVQEDKPVENAEKPVIRFEIPQKNK